MIRTLLAITAVGACAAGQAFAADGLTASVNTGASAHGAVLVGRDSGFSPLLGDSGVLQKGQRILVRQGGHASLTYADGCKVDLKGGSMATIGSASPCAGAGSAFQPVDSTVNVPGVGPVSTTTAVIGGVVLAGVGVGLAAAAGAFDSDNNNTPVSP